MGLVLKTLGCNGLCGNCYENKIRAANTAPEKVDLDAALALIHAESLKPKEQRCNAPTLHGGEPLLLPVDRVDRFLSEVYSGWGQSGVQTNGTILNDALIEIFKKYHTNIGISIDGDTAALNRGRWNAGKLNIRQIQEKTDLVMGHIRRLRDCGISVSVIALLRSHNAAPDRIDEFIRFLRRLDREFGVCDLRTNPVISFIPEFKAEELSPADLLNAYRTIFSAMIAEDHPLPWLPYRDFIDLTLGHTRATCNFVGCDPWHTISEQPIGAAGFVGTCLKVGGSQDGVFSMIADERRPERELMLVRVPMTEGGCAGCRYWMACRGGCPGEGADGDYRNKSRFCLAIKGFFEYVETRLRSMFPILKTAFDFGVQDAALPLDSIRKGAWQKQYEMPKEAIAEEAAKRRAACGPGGGGHGDSAHGDRPHQDAHGDHLDKGGAK